jgi:hypothetical protein
MELSLISLVIVFIGAILARMYIPRFMIKRAIYSVIRIFKQYNAITIRDAKTIDELGLNPKPLIDGMHNLRDYKSYALQILRTADIIRTTEDGRLYLNEGQLQTSKYGGHIN